MWTAQCRAVPPTRRHLHRTECVRCKRWTNIVSLQQTVGEVLQLERALRRVFPIIEARSDWPIAQLETPATFPTWCSLRMLIVGQLLSVLHVALLEKVLTLLLVRCIPGERNAPLTVNIGELSMALVCEIHKLPTCYPPDCVLFVRILMAFRVSGVFKVFTVFGGVGFLWWFRLFTFFRLFRFLKLFRISHVFMLCLAYRLLEHGTCQFRFPDLQVFRCSNASIRFTITSGPNRPYIYGRDLGSEQLITRHGWPKCRGQGRARRAWQIVIHIA